MSMHKASLSTCTCTTLPLPYDHVSPSVNTAVWTLLCEHASVNCFFKSIVPCMSMHNASLSTYTCTTLPLAYHHVSPSVNTTLWTCICQLFLEKHIVPYVYLKLMFIYIYMYYTTTCISPCVTICEQCVNTTLWTCICTLNPCTMYVSIIYVHVLHYHLHITMCHHLWTICEHYCVNMHLWIASLNPLYHVCASIIYFYLHLHVLHYHLPCVSNMWTLLCELASVNCFFKSIVPCMCIYNLFLSTYTCTTLPLLHVIYCHISPCVTICEHYCEHYSVNIHL